MKRQRPSIAGRLRERFYEVPLSRPAIEGFSFADAEARKNTSKQVVGGELARNFVECLLSRAQLLRNQLTSAPLTELPRAFLHVSTCSRERIEMALTRGHSAGLGGVEAHR